MGLRRLRSHGAYDRTRGPRHGCGEAPEVVIHQGDGRMKVFAVAGMPGAGKSTVMELAVDAGFYVIRMGDLVLEEVRSRGLAVTDENVGEMATRMRREDRARVVGKRVPLRMFYPEMEREMLREGLGYWAKRTVERIRETCASPVAFIDGTRGDMEIRVFRRRFNDFKVIAVHASRDERYRRVRSRHREDDIASMEGLEKRDRRELSWGVGNVIATADIMLVNDGTLEEFRVKSVDLIRMIRA